MPTEGFVLRSVARGMAGEKRVVAMWDRQWQPQERMLAFLAGVVCNGLSCEAAMPERAPAREGQA